MSTRDTPARSPSPSQPDVLPLHAEPGHLMRRAHQLAVSTFHDTHGRSITPVQYAVLRALLDHPGIDQVTLAQHVALDTSTTADIATRLEAKGWVIRELLPRRQRALYLSPQGQAVLNDMLPHVHAVHEGLLSPLAPEERAELLRLLHKLLRLPSP
jgi:DNA-binding MarR family transcriptional regulator